MLTDCSDFEPVSSVMVHPKQHYSHVVLVIGPLKMDMVMALSDILGPKNDYGELLIVIGSETCY